MKISKLIEPLENIYHSIRRTVNSKTYNIKSRCQRFKRGYSYGDVWDMDDWFIQTAKPMLTHLKNNGMSYPTTFKSREEWEQVLGEMIGCLELMNIDDAYNYLGFCKFEDRMCITSEDYARVNEVMTANKNKFFELFSEYFYDIWD